MDENSSKIIAFSKQLQDENITDTERAVIEKQINKLTTRVSAIVANTIGRIGDMPTVLHQEVFVK
jgi:hypothetical protein